MRSKKNGLFDIRDVCVQIKTDWYTNVTYANQKFWTKAGK